MTTTPPPVPTTGPTRIVVNFSGGLASAYAAHRVIERYGRKGVVLLFADTNYEDADLYRFMAEVSDALGLPITRIADGRTPWQVFRDVRFLGNTRVDPCSRILKRELLNRWMDRHAPGAIAEAGIWFDESHRLDGLRARSGGRFWDSPLLWKPWATQADAERWLAGLGIKRGESYELGFGHDNCGGRCIKQGQAGWALLLKTRPDSYAECEREEQGMRDMLGDVSILRDRRGGTTKTLTLRVLRERLEQTGELFDPTDCATGCGCAIDDYAEVA